MVVETRKEEINIESRDEIMWKDLWMDRDQWQLKLENSVRS